MYPSPSMDSISNPPLTNCAVIPISALKAFGLGVVPSVAASFRLKASYTGSYIDSP